MKPKKEARMFAALGSWPASGIVSRGSLAPLGSLLSYKKQGNVVVEKS